MKKSRAANRTINILEVIANATKGLSLSEIARALDIPITSVNDIIKALLEEEFIELLDSRSKVYGIGVKAFSIGNAFIANNTLIDKATGIIETLMSRTNRTAFLAKEVNGEGMYIFKREPKNAIIATCTIGNRMSLHCTSLGKSFLAYSPKLMERLRNTELPRKTPYTITDYYNLQQDIEKVRERGFAVDKREENEHLLCVGAPIFDSNHQVIAAISVSGMYSEDADIDGLGRLVKESALAISRSMGYVP